MTRTTTAVPPRRRCIRPAALLHATALLATTALLIPTAVKLPPFKGD